MGMPPLEYKKMKKGGLPIILIQYLLHPGRCGIGIANLATEFQQLALHLFDFTGMAQGDDHPVVAGSSRRYGLRGGRRAGRRTPTTA